MTVTPPPGTRTSRRGLRMRAVALIGVLVAALALATLTPTAAAATPSAAASTSNARSATAAIPAVSPIVPAGQTVFTLAPRSNGIVRPGEPLVASVTLQNGTNAPTTPRTVTLRLGSEPLPDRGALRTWLSGGAADAALVDVGQGDLAAVAAGGAETGVVVVAADHPALAGRAAGVYPLSASIDTPRGAVVSTSAMIVPPAAATPAPIGIVVPITAGPLTQGLLTGDELEQLTAPFGELTNQLDGVTGSAAILAVDPAIPAAIRALGSSAPATALEWLARLEALPNSRFALQFGDADAAVQLSAGQPAPAQPISLQAYLQPEDFVPGNSAPPTPTPTPTLSATPTPTPTPTPATTPGQDATPTPEQDPNEPVYPTLAELLDIGTARPGVYWPAPDTTTPDAVAALGALTDGEPTLTLVPSTATTAGAAGATVPARANAGEAGLLVYDTDVSRELHAATMLDGLGLRGAPLTAATAYLAFAAQDAAGAPLLVTLDRAGAQSQAAISAALAAATTAPGMLPVDLGVLARSAPHSTEVADALIDEVGVAAASALFEDETAFAQFATVLTDPTLLTGPERAEILQLLSVEWTDDPAAWGTAVSEHRAQTVAGLDSVGILPLSTIQLLGTESTLPVWVRNDLPYAVDVELIAAPDSLRLDVQRSTVVTAGANSNTRVDVPVRARVGSGEVTIDLALRSPALVPIGSARSVDVIVRAEWESVGLIVLGTLVTGFLLLGVWRTMRRLRRRSVTDAAPADAAEPDAAAPAAPEADAPVAPENEERIP